MEQTITSIFRAKTDRLLEDVASTLKGAGYVPQATKDYVYAAGTVPVLLVAHADTVHHYPPSTVCYDPKLRIFWSPDGLGADDRAGVFAILQIVKQGLRPSVLITDGEEQGCTGARAAVKALRRPEVNLVIELDRAGADDYVAYGWQVPKALASRLKKLGFRPASGTFTDISELCPEWGLVGVNLSVGYYRQHQESEYLRFNELLSTIRRVTEILRHPPGPLVYKEDVRIPAVYYSTIGGWARCDICDDLLPSGALVEVDGCSICIECLRLIKPEAVPKRGNPRRDWRKKK